MAIAFDASSYTTTTPFAATTTLSHTATAGAYVLAAFSGTANTTLSSVTYGGTAMTLLGSQKLGNQPTLPFLIYGLANVAGGSKTISGSWGGSNFGAIEAVSYNGVSGATFLSSNFGSGSTSQSSGSLTCPATNVVVQAFATNNFTSSSLSGGTNRVIRPFVTGGDGMTFSDATATTTFTSTTSSNTNWASLSVVLSPSAASPNNQFFQMF